MKAEELAKLVKRSIEVVAVHGRDAARIYHVVVELDSQVIALRKQVKDLELQLDLMSSEDPEERA